MPGLQIISDRPKHRVCLATATQAREWRAARACLGHAFSTGEVAMDLTIFRVSKHPIHVAVLQCLVGTNNSGSASP